MTTNNEESVFGVTVSVEDLKAAKKAAKNLLSIILISVIKILFKSTTI